MKKIFLVIVFIISCSLASLYAQNNDGVGIPTDIPSESYTVVDEMPEFPDGQNALMTFLSNNIQYPAMAKDQGIQGKVYASFVVGTEGNIYNIQITRGIGGGCDEEVLRVLKKMPKWKPGKLNGKNVMVKYTLPVSFTIR
jgi:protein TonB